MNSKFLIITGAIMASMAFTACETTTPSNNSRVTVNNNTGVVANSNANLVNNNNNTSTVTTGNSNTRNSNVNRADYDKNKAEYEKDKGSSSIGQGANDSWLWFKTKSALATTDDLRDSTINVDVANDVVTLKGTVATAAQKTKAETTAKGIEGVKSVKNDLQVKANDSMTNQMVNGTSNTKANTNK